MMHLETEAYLDEFLKISKADGLPKKKRGWRKVLPAVGALAGGALGLRSGAGSGLANSRLIRGVIGAGTGSTLGGLPSVFEDAQQGLTRKTSAAKQRKNTRPMRVSTLLRAVRVEKGSSPKIGKPKALRT